MSESLSPADIVTREMVSVSMLKTAFDNAFMEASVDDGGLLRVDADVWFYVMPSDRGDHIRLLAPCWMKEGVDRSVAVELAGRINLELIMVRAAVREKRIDLDHYLMVDGGVTLKSIVLTAKTFAWVCRDALGKAGPGVFT